MTTKFKLQPYEGERSSLEQWFGECSSKYGFEAEQYLDKKVEIILSNNFHFSGLVVNVLEDTLILFDKFDVNVSIKLLDIMILSEVSNGD